jgi:hypothetical protein
VSVKDEVEMMEKSVDDLFEGINDILTAESKMSESDFINISLNKLPKVSPDLQFSSSDIPEFRVISESELKKYEDLINDSRNIQSVLKKLNLNYNSIKKQYLANNDPDLFFEAKTSYTILNFVSTIEAHSTTHFSKFSNNDNVAERSCFGAVLGGFLGGALSGCKVGVSVVPSWQACGIGAVIGGIGGALGASAIC